MLRRMPPEPPPPSRPPEPGRGGAAWGTLATRNARLLLATRLVGQFSDGLLQAALGSFVLFSPERQASAAQVAGAFALLLLPYSLVGPFAGVLLDRWSRVRVLVWANLARGVTTLGIAALVDAGHDGLDLGATVLVALGFGRLVLAGLSASLPRVVAAEHLVTANALFPTAGTISAAVATVTGLGLMRVLGPEAPTRLVVAVAVGLVLAALVASRIPVPDLGPSAEERRNARGLGAELVAVVDGMVAGVAHLRGRPRAARALAVVVLHRVAFGALMVSALVVVRATLNAPSEAGEALSDFALAAGGASGGALLSAVVTPRAVAALGLARWPAITLGVAGVAAPLAAGTVTLTGLIATSFVMGFAGQAVKIVGDTTLQSDVADEFRGRIFTLYDVALNAGLVAGICLSAFVSPPSGVAPGLWLAVGGMLVATAVWSLRPVPPSG